MSAKPFFIEYRLPLFWQIAFSCMVIFYSIQPWSFWISGVPVQVWLCLVLTTYLVLLRNNIYRLSIAVLSGAQKIVLLLALLFMIIGASIGVIQWLRVQQYVTGILLLILTVANIKSYRGEFFLYFSIASVVLVSGAVALMQYFGMAGWSWNRTVYAFSGQKIPSGLESFPVALAYSMIAIAVVGGSTFLVKANSIAQKGMLNTWIAGAVFFFSSAALIVAESRSGIAGVGIGLSTVIIMIYFTRSSRIRQAQAVAVIIGLVVVSGVFGYQAIEGFIEKAGRAEGDMRLGKTWNLFIPIIIDNPLGISELVFDEALERVGLYNPEVEKYRSVLYQTGGHAPHNIILTTALFLGIPLMLLMVLFYGSVITKSFKAIKLKPKDHPQIVLKLIIVTGAIFGLFFHSWFHNANIFYGEMRGWIWIGAIVAYTRFLESISS